MKTVFLYFTNSFIVCYNTKYGNYGYICDLSINDDETFITIGIKLTIFTDDTLKSQLYSLNKKDFFDQTYNDLIIDKEFTDDIFCEFLNDNVIIISYEDYKNKDDDGNLYIYLYVEKLGIRYDFKIESINQLLDYLENDNSTSVICKKFHLVMIANPSTLDYVCNKNSIVKINYYIPLWDLSYSLYNGKLKIDFNNIKDYDCSIYFNESYHMVRKYTYEGNENIEADKFKDLKKAVILYYKNKFESNSFVTKYSE